MAILLVLVLIAFGVYIYLNKAESNQTNTPNTKQESNQEKVEIPNEPQEKPQNETKPVETVEVDKVKYNEKLKWGVINNLLLFTDFKSDENMEYLTDAKSRVTIIKELKRKNDKDKQIEVNPVSFSGQGTAFYKTKLSDLVELSKKAFSKPLTVEEIKSTIAKKDKIEGEYLIHEEFFGGADGRGFLLKFKSLTFDPNDEKHTLTIHYLKPKTTDNYQDRDDILKPYENDKVLTWDKAVEYGEFVIKYKEVNNQKVGESFKLVLLP